LGNRFDQYDLYESRNMAGWDFFPAIGLEFLRSTRMRLHADFRYMFTVDTKFEQFGHGPGFMVGLNF